MLYPACSDCCKSHFSGGFDVLNLEDTALTVQLEKDVGQELWERRLSVIIKARRIWGCMICIQKLFFLTLDKASKITSLLSRSEEESEAFRWKVTVWKSESKIQIKIHLFKYCRYLMYINVKIDIWTFHWLYLCLSLCQLWNPCFCWKCQQCFHFLGKIQHPCYPDLHSCLTVCILKRLYLMI